MDRPQAPDLYDALAVAGVAASNALMSLSLPRRYEIPVGLGAAAAMVAIARAGGVAPNDMGLERRNLPRGMVIGAAVGIPAGAVVIAGALIPATRRFYHDERIVTAGVLDAAYEILARAPLATALAEEITFRSALEGTLGRRRSPLRAVALSATLFGIWHVLPTWRRMHTNPGTATLHQGSAVRQSLSIAAVVVATGIAGVGLSWLRRTSRSVATPFIVHAAINCAGLLAGWLGSRATGETDGVSH